MPPQATPTLRPTSGIWQRLIGITTVACALAAAPALRASTLAAYTTGGTVSNAGTNLNTGYSFTVTTPVTVTELDICNSGALASTSIQVGIFDSTGSLVISTTISTGSPQTTVSAPGGESFIGSFVTPTALATGSYVIAAHFIAADQAVINGTVSTIPEITFGTPLVSFSSTFGKPTTTFPSHAFGPSFQIAAVPEPSSFTLIGSAFAMSAFGFRARRRTA